MNRITLCLRSCFTRPDVAVALARAVAEHWRIEVQFQRRIQSAMTPEEAVSFPHLGLAPLQYFQRNFFSALFLSIYRTIGITRDRREKYGLIMHALRGVITSADNILDDDDKGAVRLSLDGGRVLPNILSILLQDEIMHDAIDELTDDPSSRRKFRKALMGALYDIALEESGEERDIEAALPPERILDTIHRFRGGRLLQLAFVAPKAGEPGLADRIDKARQAVGNIGVGLQVLDDVTDFAEDIERRNHNILRSWIVHRGPDGMIDDGALLRLEGSELARPEQRFPRATKEILALALELACDGFGMLHSLGHVIDRAAALDLIKLMFELRGLSRFWELASESPVKADYGREAARLATW